MKTRHDPRHSAMTEVERSQQRKRMVEHIYGEGHPLGVTMIYDCGEMSDHNFYNLCCALARFRAIEQGKSETEAMAETTSFLMKCLGGYIKKVAGKK